MTGWRRPAWVGFRFGWVGRRTVVGGGLDSGLRRNDGLMAPVVGQAYCRLAGYVMMGAGGYPPGGSGAVVGRRAHFGRQPH